MIAGWRTIIAIRQFNLMISICCDAVKPNSTFVHIWEPGNIWACLFVEIWYCNSRLLTMISSKQAHITPYVVRVLEDAQHTLLCVTCALSKVTWLYNWGWWVRSSQDAFIITYFKNNFMYSTSFMQWECYNEDLQYRQVTKERPK